MEELNIFIIKCPQRSYKLQGENIGNYYEAALKSAKDIYTNYYRLTYKILSTNNFNPLWASSQLGINNIDPKDGFWDINHFYFCTSLIKLLNKDFDVIVTDKTKGQFIDFYFIESFLKNENIPFQKNSINPVRLFLYNLKRTIYRLPTQFGKRLSKKFKSLKTNYFYKKTAPKYFINNGARILYLLISPVSSINLHAYLKWRHADLLEMIKLSDYKLILISSKDFDDSDNSEYPIININSMVTRTDLLWVTIHSMIYKRRVKIIVKKELKRSHGNPEYEFFLKNMPFSFFKPLKQHVGLDKLFRTYEPGLLISKGSIVNKGACIYNYNAQKHGLRILNIAGRILTMPRLSNRICDIFMNQHDNSVIPHSMIVFDKISYKTIKSQTNKIKLYFLANKPKPIQQRDLSSPFRITIILQKKNEMKQLIEEVLTAVKPFKEEVILNMKMHPNFPIPQALNKKYNIFPFVKILDLDSSLEDVIQSTDLCITAYSTASIAFAVQGVPVVWLTNITNNSLFLSDLYKEIGLTSNHHEDLKDIIYNMIHSPDYYHEQSIKIYNDMTKFTTCPNNDDVKSNYLEILENEFNLLQNHNIHHREY